MSPYIYIAVSTILGVCGQLLLKHGMTKMGQRSNTSMLQGIITSPWVIGGLLVYGSGVVFWLLALSSFPISYVYPFASLSYIGILIGSYLIFHEPLNRIRIFGIATIIAGVLITSIS